MGDFVAVLTPPKGRFSGKHWKSAFHRADCGVLKRAAGRFYSVNEQGFSDSGVQFITENTKICQRCCPKQ